MLVSVFGCDVGHCALWFFEGQGVVVVILICFVFGVFLFLSVCSRSADSPPEKTLVQINLNF